MDQTDNMTLLPRPFKSPRMSVMRVIVLHPYTKFEVRRPSHSEDIADFWSRH